MAQVVQKSANGTYVGEDGGKKSGAGVLQNKTSKAGINVDTNMPTGKIVDYTKKNTAQLTNTTRSSSSSSGSDGSSGVGGYSAPSSSGTDDIINMLKKLLNEQKAAADEYYKTMYEQQMAQIKQQAEANRNQANLNYMRGDRYLKSMYGTSGSGGGGNPSRAFGGGAGNNINVSGQGLSNLYRNHSNWQNNLASSRQNEANNAATATSNYNLNRSNAAAQLAQGWYNYILPVYTNRQTQLDDLNYRKYVYGLGL